MRCNINKGRDGVVNAVLLGAFIVKLLLRNVGLRCANPTYMAVFYVNLIAAMTIPPTVNVVANDQIIK